ncbi:hypothetical protein POM88_054742 [Heracleum sosnowskyi]|uniref:Pentatricopeptide repeat-containing protein n=1 Tax=Heracleum sosnowskyi TaxID=360622 RepID=A0AAD8GMM6_9APIA|nr:hypothetical protein POM88_054742 [Heracleum sosnowskyi]
MQKYSAAVSMSRELRVLCFPVNIVTFNNIIKCCCHLNNTLDYAFSLLGGMIKSGLVPNVVTYTTLIKGLLSQDRPVDAEHLFKKLLTFNEVQPNVVTYSIVIDGLCKISNGYCKRQKVDKSIDLLRQMPAEGLKPGVETYNTIIHGLFQMGRHDGFCKNQQIDEAISFFGLMEYLLSAEERDPSVLGFRSRFYFKGCHLQKTMPSISGEDSECLQRSKWLQAAVLGPNDCLVSATSLMMGTGLLRRETKKIKRNGEIRRSKD